MELFSLIKAFIVLISVHVLISSSKFDCKISVFMRLLLVIKETMWQTY